MSSIFVVFDQSQPGPIIPAQLYYRQANFGPPVGETQPHFLGAFRPVRLVIHADYWQNAAGDVAATVVVAPAATGYCGTSTLLVFDQSRVGPLRQAALYYQNSDTFAGAVAVAETNTHFLARFNPVAYSRFAFNHADIEPPAVETNPHFIGTFRATRLAVLPSLFQTTNTDFFIPPQPETNVHFLARFRPVVYQRFAFNSWDVEPPAAETQPHFIARFQPARISLLGGLRQNPANDRPPEPETNVSFIGRFRPIAYSQFRYNHLDIEPPVAETQPHFLARFNPIQLNLLHALWQLSVSDIPPLGIQAETNTHFIAGFSQPVFTRAVLGNLIFNTPSVEGPPATVPVAPVGWVGKRKPKKRWHDLPNGYRVYGTDEEAERFRRRAREPVEQLEEPKKEAPVQASPAAEIQEPAPASREPAVAEPTKLPIVSVPSTPARGAPASPVAAEPKPAARKQAGAPTVEQIQAVVREVIDEAVERAVAQILAAMDSKSAELESKERAEQLATAADAEEEDELLASLIGGDAGMGEPTVYVCRHGSTQFNLGGVGRDRIRGHLDVPLDAQGEADARRLADHLAEAPLGRIFSSDMSRARATAQAIAGEHPGAAVEASSKLRSWNLGDLQGQKTTPAVIDRIVHFVENPLEEPAGGESFDSFMRGFIDEAERILGEAAVDGSAVAIVTHARNVQLLELWLRAGQDVERMAEQEAEELASEPDAIEPGGFMRLGLEGGKWRIAQFFKRNIGKRESGPPLAS